MSVEESPEFEKALQEACEKQYRGWLFGGGYAQASSKDRIADTMDEIQRQRKEIEERVENAKKHADQIRREAKIIGNPHMRMITENLKLKYSVETDLICPVCGEGDHGNRIGGKPYCLMNAKHKKKGIHGPVPLMSPSKAKKWVPPKKMKTLQELIDEDLNIPKDRVYATKR